MTLVEEVRALIAEAINRVEMTPGILDVLSDEIVAQVRESVTPHEVLSIDTLSIESGAVTCRFRRREEIATNLERTGFYFTEAASKTVRPPSFAALAALACLMNH